MKILDRKKIIFCKSKQKWICRLQVKEENKKIADQNAFSSVITSFRLQNQHLLEHTLE